MADGCRMNVLGPPLRQTEQRAAGGVAAAMALWLGACGLPTPATQPESTPAANPPSATSDASASSLAHARAAIRHGRLPQAVQDELLASDAAEQARARRLLAAVVTAKPAASRVIEPTRPSNAGEPPSLLPIVPSPGGELAVASARPAPAVATPKDPTPRETSLARLDRITVRRTSTGATLHLEVAGGVQVGVVNQPDAHMVRLLVEVDDAASSVLSARPAAAGVRVHDISRGTRRLHVTLALDPGWRFERAVRTSNGARVELQRPAT